ncbi:hypothetical protein EV05_1888 [Prochlorococcus sp. MIT 0601]|nr:hypothetical protein EV05_1888 [Prochlorococcus sp. MIT 0601]
MGTLWLDPEKAALEMKKLFLYFLLSLVKVYEKLIKLSLKVKQKTQNCSMDNSLIAYSFYNSSI